MIRHSHFLMVPVLKKPLTLGTLDFHEFMLHMINLTSIEEGYPLCVFFVSCHLMKYIAGLPVEILAWC